MGSSPMGRVFLGHISVYPRNTTAEVDDFEASKPGYPGEAGPLPLGEREDRALAGTAGGHWVFIQSG